MSQATIATLILLGSFIGLLILRFPVLFSVGISSLITFMYLDVALGMIISNMVKGVNSFSLMSIPFFVLAGEIMSAGGISDRLVLQANSLVGQFRGGLAHVNVLGSMFFGGVSGSPVADISSLGSIEIPMMEKAGYDTDFTCGVTMASSIQGLLIPPSHNMIIFATSAGSVSIAGLFMAGMGPGVLLGLILMIYCYICAVKRNYPRGERFSFKNLWNATKKSILAMLTIVIILIGVLTGICTATEAAAVACVWAFFITFFVYKQIPLRDFGRIVKKAMGTLATIMILIGISSGFGWVLAYLKVPNIILTAVMSITKSKVLILLMMNFFLLLLGMVMDMSSSIIITTPILLPIAIAIGMNPLQFGIMLIFNLGIGLLTPPVGSVLFVTSGLSGRTMEQLVKAMVPFYIVMFSALMLVTFVPQFSLTLPRLMGYC